MPSLLSEKLVETEKELARRLAEAEHLGDCLIKMGNHLKLEPWKYAIGWLDADSPGVDTVYLVEREIEDAMDKHRLMWLLDDIRILRRRQRELQKIVPA